MWRLLLVGAFGAARGVSLSQTAAVSVANLTDHPADELESSPHTQG